MRKIIGLSWLKTKATNPASYSGVNSRTFYDVSSKHDTIYAPASNIEPVKGSPLAIVRISGNNTQSILQSLARRALGRDGGKLDESRHLKPVRPRVATLAELYCISSNELIDKAVVLWFPGPKSYTGEDVCELHIHGSPAILRKILDQLGSFAGCRPAEAGEFTRRALNNGKFSLLQAEALPELIASKTEMQRKLALKGVSGSTKAMYEKWIEELINILAHLEASIDFGEDELIGEEQVIGECRAKVNRLADDLSSFIHQGMRCRDFISQGFKVAILGRPNSGKSTFMNLLCQRERSIVSDLSGTTRDVVEHHFELAGHRITLSDTAGLRQASEFVSEHSDIQRHLQIEQQGMRKALEVASESDLIIYLIDATRLLDLEERPENLDLELEPLSVVQTGSKDRNCRPVQLVVNKIDLIPAAQLSHIENLLVSRMGPTNCVSTISCLTRANMDATLKWLGKRLDSLALGTANVSSESLDNKLDFINERHLSLLKSCLNHLSKAKRLDMAHVDQAAQQVREAVDYLSRIVGTVTNDDVIDTIFRDFCIGK